MPGYRLDANGVEMAKSDIRHRYEEEMSALQIVYAMGADGTPMAPMESRVWLNDTSRREQAETATELSAMLKLVGQYGSGIIAKIASGEYRAEGRTDAEKREYTITLVEAKTKKVIGSVTDIYNVGGSSMSMGGSNLDLTATIEAPAPTPPNGY
jgi:hypothetical protein